MPTFQYTARDQRGGVTRGTVEADSNTIAVSLLREQGLWVTGLHPVGVSASPRVAPAGGGLLDAWWTGVSLRDQAIFFRQLGAMVHAGMPLSRSLAILDQQTSNRRLRRITADLAAQVSAGGKLADAFRRHPGVFRPLTLSLLEAGEEGGMLDPILHRIAEYLEREHEIRQQIKRRTLYTKFLLAAGIFIPPIKVLIFDGLAAYLRATVGMVLPVLLVFAAIWVVCRFLFQFAAFRTCYDAVKLAVPMAGKSVRQFASGKFFRAMGALYGAGLPVPRAMRLSADACDNSVIGGAVRRQIGRVERGEPLSAALAGTRLFSPVTLGMVVTGEEAGDMEAMLTKVADYQEREAEHRTGQLLIILPVLGYLCVAAYMGYLIVSSYMGYATTAVNLFGE